MQLKEEQCDSYKAPESVSMARTEWSMCCVCMARTEWSMCRVCMARTEWSVSILRVTVKTDAKEREGYGPREKI